MPRGIKASPVTTVETLERIDPEGEDFSDVDGDYTHQFTLKDEDPTRQYVWVHDNPGDIGKYKGSLLKYAPVYAEADAVRPVADPGHEDGQVVRMMDHVLMSCDRALWEKRKRYESLTNQRERNQVFRKNSRGEVALRRDDKGRWSRVNSEERA